MYKENEGRLRRQRTISKLVKEYSCSRIVKRLAESITAQTNMHKHTVYVLSYGGKDDFKGNFVTLTHPLHIFKSHIQDSFKVALLIGSVDRFVRRIFFSS